MSARKLFVEEGSKWLVRTTYGILAIVLLYLFTPVGERIKTIWNSPDTQERILDTQIIIIERLSRLEEIEQANRIPERVARFRGASGPIEGKCVEGDGYFDRGGGCLIRAVIVRYANAFDCEILPGADFFWYNPDTDVESTARPHNATNPVNVGAGGRSFLWRVPVPEGLRPPDLLDYCVRSSYTRCPGMSQNPESDESYTPPDPICIEDIAIVAADE